MKRFLWLGLWLGLFACGGAPEVVATPPPRPAATVELGAWRPFALGAWIAPKTSPIDASGAVTLIWHFHACKAAEQDYRALAAKAVVVCVDNLGLGTTPYWNAFKDPARFESLERDVLESLAREWSRPDAHVARRVLVAWSAGYASVQQILSVRRYYDAVDAVVLLDGLHAGYSKDPNGAPTKTPNLQTVEPILRYATDAAAGDKTFVLTHSAVVPLGYASTTEMANALVERLKLTRSPGDPDFGHCVDVADLGGAHVRGFDGADARAHVAQLHWVTLALRKWVFRRDG